MSSGSIIPGSLVAVYQFTHEELINAVKDLFQSTNVKLPPLIEYLPDGDIDVDFPDKRTEVNFDSINTVLTYVHEQFHIKQLSASPIGFALWSLQMGFYNTASIGLEKWSEAHANDEQFSPTLPLIHDGELDDELNPVKINSGAQSTIVWCLRRQERFGTHQVAKTILPGLFEMLGPICKTCFGTSGEIPTFRPPANEDQPLDLGGLSGEAIIEGFARTNEYLLLRKMGTPEQIIRRSKILRDHGVYVLAPTTVEQLLDVPREKIDIVTARLCDWAMQAPILPIFYKAGDEVNLNEIMPNWRFAHLASAAQRLKLTAEDFIDNASETESLLFGELGWMSPTEVATQFTQQNSGNPIGGLTKIIRAKLDLAAKNRLSNPDSLAMPVDDEEYRLRASVSFFKCGSFLPSAGIEGFEHWRGYPHMLLRYQVIDTLCFGNSFSASRWLSGHIARYYQFTDSEPFLLEAIEKQVGNKLAIKMLSSNP